MSKAIFVIYKHTSPSGKSYIGQTRDYRRRVTAHKSKNSGCNAFRKAIEKYGWDNFTHEILASNLTLEEANKLEAELINSYNTLSPHGYNLFTGGDNKVPSEETLNRMRAKKLSLESINKMKATKARNGFRPSEEHKALISKIHKGRIKSPEERANISKARIGMKLSAETRNKIAEAKKIYQKKLVKECQFQQGKEGTPKNK